MSNINYHNKAGSCPICGEYHSKKVCRSQTLGDVEIHYCWRGENAPSQYKSLGFTDFGIEKFILRKEGDRETWQDKAIRRINKAQRRAIWRGLTPEQRAMCVAIAGGAE